jgi:hypothetical protein
MKPKIEKTKFGSITIAGEKYEHDVLIRMDGKIEKRKKKLSKEVFGTSHIISKAEAEYVFEEGMETLLVGAGQEGLVKLSDEAAAFFKRKGCAVELLPTPKAIQRWNEASGKVAGLFHVTC